MADLPTRRARRWGAAVKADGARHAAPRSLVVGGLLTALVALGQISTSIYIPSMPSIVAELESTAGRVNLTLSGFLVGFAVCQLVFGPLSDRFGRRPTLAIGLGMYIFASALCMMAGDIGTLTVGRVLQGMAACVGPVLGRAIVRDVYGPEDTAKAMAYIGAALAVSPAMAPILGGYLQEWFGWRAAFVFLTGAGTVLLVATRLLLAETGPRQQAGADVRHDPGLLAACGLLLGDRRYLGHTLAVACIFSGLMAFAAGGPFVFIGLLGLSPARYGMLAIFTVGGYLLGSLSAGRMAGRIPAYRLMLLGIVACIAGGSVMTALAVSAPLSIAAIVAPMALFAAGLGVVLPAGIAGAMAPFPRIAGAASALLGFVQMLVAAAAAFMVGAMPHDSALPMAAVIAAGAALALPALTILARPTPGPGHRGH